MALFENLTARLSRTVDTLRGRGRITEENVGESLREVRMALLEADVALPVVKTFIDEIPRELDEAAFVDGATHLQTITRVILPLSLQGMMASGIFVFVYSWNEYLFALIFTTLFSKDFGVVNALIGRPIDWLGDAFWAHLTIAFVVFWRYLGWNVVLYLSALQAIPDQMYEAAALDGAGAWRRLWSITLPQLRATTVLITVLQVLSIIGSLFMAVAYMSDPSVAGEWIGVVFSVILVILLWTPKASRFFTGTPAS